MAVYGKIEVDKIDEYQVINNPNNYGISKLLGEQDLINCSKFLDNRISIIRLPGVVGENIPLLSLGNYMNLYLIKRDKDKINIC